MARQNSSSGALTAVSSCAVEPPALLEDVEAAELVDGGADCRSQTLRVGHIGTDRNRLVASEMRGFLAGQSVDLGNSHYGPFACEQHGGGAADPAAGASDEGYLACQPGHRFFSRSLMRKQR